ncbi:MAG: ROK family protein [Bacteroidota bacterium]
MASKVLGIDIGGTGIKGAPVHLKRGDLLADRHRIPPPQPATPEAVAEAVGEIAKHFDWKGPVGCALPGVVRQGTVYTAANIDKGWIGTNAQKLLRKVLPEPPVVLNDADAAGLAEVRYGAGRRRKRGSLVLLTFGTGIGSALFRDGDLVPNTELGHLHFFVDGHRGIAEHYAAARQREDDELSWSDWAERVQAFLDYVEELLNPDTILIGGGVSKHKRWSQFGHLLTTRAKLLPAELQNNAGIVGAAAAAR